MLRHFARALLYVVLTAFTASPSLLALEIAIPGPGVPANDKEKAEKDKADKGAKPVGPSHNVTLLEEPGATDLFNRAKKARARAEKDPEAWPECVKCYADILKKYPNSVYLDKWEGAEKTEPAYTNGLYRSTRVRVAAELATLPPAALAVYRVINDPPARALFLESQQQLDERKMEQAARDYFLTTWGDNALAWLAEFAQDRGAPREALTRYRQAVERPGNLASPTAILARTLLIQIKLGDKADAVKTLEELASAMNDPKKGALRVARDEGQAAFDKLKARVDALTQTGATADKSGNKEEDVTKWETYFGNPAHNKQAQSRPGAGLRTWSARIDDLLYGKGVVGKERPEVEAPPPSDGTGPVTTDPSMNQQLTIANGHFYINDNQVYAAYPTSDPRPGALAAQGNALFQLPAEGVKSPPNKKKPDANRNNGAYQMPPPVIQHPYFSTHANGFTYGVLGPESYAADATNRMNGIRFFRGGRGVSEEDKGGPSNYLVCIGRPDNGGDHALLWSLKPGEPAYNRQSKTDQEWLKGVYFPTSPTYENGLLYTQAVQISATTLDSFVAAFDAATGRLMWKTQICSNQPLLFASRVQPDRGLPVAVAGRTVYSVTNLGAVAALDAGSGAVKWIRVYDRVKTNNNNMFGMGEMATGRDFWAPNPPIVYQNRLIVTPQDSASIYAYDTESGARTWEFYRYNSDPKTPPRQDERGTYKHILGIVNGVLVLSGEHIHFITIKNGRITRDPVVPENPIRGRGTVTANQIFVSTDAGLLSINVSAPEPGQPNATNAPIVIGKTELFPWGDSKEEAGTVYAADGILYTVSHTHVNAYIVWQELESKLKEQLAAHPDDVETRIKLANVYKNIERFDAALAELDAALATNPKNADKLRDLISRRFDALLSLGGGLEKAGKNADALARFKEAAALATERSLPPVMSVMAVKASAELLEKTIDLPAAAAAWQLLLDKHSDVVYQFQAQSALKAGLYARTRLNALVAKDPKSYAPIEEQAKAARTEAGSDPKKLEAVIRRFPNSTQSSSALLTLARTELEKSPDRARLSAQRFLNHKSQAKSAEDTAGAAQALAILAVASERINLSAAARDALLKLANSPEFNDAKISPDGKAPDVAAAEWARKRLEEPQFKRAPGQSVFAMGNGKLKQAWTRPNAQNATVLPLLPEGVPPVEMRRAVLSIEGGDEILALAGRDGRELWKPRPAAPANSIGRAFWYERLLIVCGEKNIIAYDSADNGAVAWKLDLNLDTSLNVIEWAQLAGGRVIVSHSAGMLEAFDASSGGALWRTKLDGSLPHAPAVGETFVACKTANSSKLSVIDLETGVERWNAQIENQSAEPIANDDRIFTATKNAKLSAFDARNGKKLCEDINTETAATALAVSGNTVFARLGRKDIVAFSVDPKKPGKEWRIFSETTENNGGMFNIGEFLVDGDELLVTGVHSNVKAELASYSIRRQGTLNWKRDIAFTKAEAPQMANMAANNFNGQIIIGGNGNQRFIVQNGQLVPVTATANKSAATPLEMPSNWLHDNAARDHLIVLQNVWDVGGQARIVALVDRVTGRAVWDTDLKSETNLTGTATMRANVQLFEGGVVLIEGRGRTAFTSANAAGEEDEYKELTERVGKNPNDHEALTRLAAADYDRGEKDKSLNALAAMLSNSKLDNVQFAFVYNQFARLRNDFAREQHPTLNFQRVEKAPDLAGGNTGWEALKEQSLSGWRSIFLASEDTTTRTQPKKDAWRGDDDLKAAFKGGYDDKNLYIQIAATDERHANTQQDASRVDFGDALTLAFDIGLSGGVGYRGETFELAIGLRDKNKATGVRRVEHGKFLRGTQALEFPFSVTRKDDGKQTLYQIALPLEYLGLKSGNTKPFGFTFALRDQDAGNDIEKSLSPSPGLAGTREPRLFSRAVLEAKK